MSDYSRKALLSKGTVYWLAVCALGLMIGVGTLVFYYSQRKEAFLTTSSPTGTYIVTLTGKKDRPSLPLIDHSVEFDVLKRGKALFVRKKLYSGDWLDASFGEWYPQHHWINEQALEFYREEFRQAFPNDTVTVKNSSGKKIALLKIVSVDILLLFELDPEATTTFSVSRPRTDSRWTSVDGEFEGGQPLSGLSMDFDVKTPGPHFFLITILENGTTITPR